MEIVVLGAGAIGSLYGAKLAEQNNVTLVGRPDHVRAIQQGGLRISGIETRTVYLQTTSRIDHIESDTLVLLTTKVPATARALEPISPLVRDDTTVVALQNGLNAEQLARDVLQGRGVVLRGISQFGAIFERPGEIRYMAKGHTILESHERSTRVAAVLTAAGLDCRISANINEEVWRKLVFNCVVNPITTIIGGKVGDIADPRLDRLKQLVIDECLVAAAAEGISISGNLLEQINAVYAGSRNIVSMQQDLLQGRVTEIDYLNGAVAGVAASRGLQCPINDALTRIIKAMEAAPGRMKQSNLGLGPRPTAKCVV